MREQIGTTLKSKAKTGKVKYWKAKVYENPQGVWIQKIWWLEDGQVQSSVPSQVESKNVGRSNETTEWEQGVFELSSIYDKQRRKGYSEDGSATHIPTKPMLAHSYSKRSHNISFPCLIQPKLDGFRMLMDGDNAWTRGAKDHVYECIEHLMFDTGGVTLDGELLLPGNQPLQYTSRAAKKFTAGVSDTLEYWVYDLVDEELDFQVRADIVLNMLDSVDCPPRVRVVPTFEVTNETELRKCHAEFMAQGYEGTMVRNKLGGYEIGHRSANLQKMKEFLDREYKVVNIVDGVGSFAGKAICVCVNEEGKEFNVTPQGTMEYREALYNNKDTYIGSWLTVRYQTLSEDLVPIFPVGVDFREVGEFET